MVVTAVDGDVCGTAVALVIVVVDGGVLALMIVVVDGGVMVEHIDPDDPENTEDSCVLKRIQAYPQSVRLKDVASLNIHAIEKTRDTSHLDRSALKDVAP